MQVWVLVIVYRGREHITLHDDEQRARQALIDFVDERRGTRSTDAQPGAAHSTEERIKLFFADEDDLYVCGSADISELDTYVGTAIER